MSKALSTAITVACVVVCIVFPKTPLIVLAAGTVICIAIGIPAAIWSLVVELKDLNK